MKRSIGIFAIFAVAGIAAAHFYPQWFHSSSSQNVMKLSGNIEAHESLPPS